MNASPTLSVSIMKPISKKRYDRPITDYLYTVTNKYGKVVMDPIIRKNVKRPHKRLTKRLDKLNAVMHSQCRGENKGKRYYWWRHRIGGPAYINDSYDCIEWHVKGIWYEDTIKYCKACGFSDETTVMWVLKYGDMLPEELSKL